MEYCIGFFVKFITLVLSSQLD